MITKIKIGGTLHVFAGTDQETGQREAWRAKLLATLKPDETAEFEDGSREFITDEEIVDTTREGSEQYIRNKTGTRVKCRRIRVHVSPDGKQQETLIKCVFKNLE